MKGRFFTLVAALSLLLCVGTWAMWVWGHWRYERVVFSIRDVLYDAEFGRGTFRVNITAGLTEPQPFGHSFGEVPDVIAAPDPPGLPEFAALRGNTEWQLGPLSGAYGRKYVVLEDDGSMLRWSLPRYSDSGHLGNPVCFWEINRSAFWPIGLGLMALPCAWTVWRLSRNYRSFGLCRKCGYDLRATPDRCPECGSVPAPFNVKS